MYKIGTYNIHDLYIYKILYIKYSLYTSKLLNYLLFYWISFLPSTLYQILTKKSKKEIKNFI